MSTNQRMPAARRSRFALAGFTGLVLASLAGAALAGDAAPEKKVTSGALNTNGTAHLPAPGTKLVLAEEDTRKTNSTLNAAPTAVASLDRIVIGSADAPITIIEYGSPTCGHCAAFHNEVLPELKKNYLDTGKAKLIFRPFMLNGSDVQAGLLLACQKPERQEALLNALYRTQRNWVPHPGWAQGQQPTEAQIQDYKNSLTTNLQSLGAKAGLTPGDFDACMSNDQNKKWLQAILNEGENVHHVSGTPTFVIDGTVKTNMSYAAFAKELDALQKKN